MQSFDQLVAGLPREINSLHLANMPTIISGQCADLKIHTDHVRIWRSRMDTRTDGERERAYVELLVDNTWVDIKAHPDYRKCLERDDVACFANVPLGNGVTFSYMKRNLPR